MARRMYPGRILVLIIMIKSSKRHIKTRLVKPYITVITANTVSKFFDFLLEVIHESLTVRPGFIFMSP